MRNRCDEDCLTCKAFAFGDVKAFGVFGVFGGFGVLDEFGE